ncbi:hypothetical protein D3C72_2377570 [compost metagenome]
MSERTKVIAAVGIARLAGTSVKIKLSTNTASPAAAAPIADTVNCPVTYPVTTEYMR